MNRYIYLIFILLVTYSPHISAQYKLHGVVRDSATNETLPFAAVVIEGTQTGKSTDMDGMFTINSARKMRGPDCFIHRIFSQKSGGRFPPTGKTSR